MAHRIDVHHHVVPPQFRGGMPVEIPDPEAQIANMERIEARAAMVSITPRILDANPGKVRPVIRACNEYSAGMMRDYPKNFGCFAALPLPDVDACLDEIAYGLDVLKMDGIGLFSNQDGRYLGDPILDEVFAELNRRQAVVFVHPAHCEPPPETHLTEPGSIGEYVYDTTRAIINLLNNGTVTRFPDVKFIFSHAGGTAPFILARLMSMNGRGQAVPNAADAMRRLHYDLAQACLPGTLRCLQEVADTDHILWGSDMPFHHGKRLEAELHHWAEYDGFSATEREAVEVGNALRLFPRLAE